VLIQLLNSRIVGISEGTLKLLSEWQTGRNFQESLDPVEGERLREKSPDSKRFL
jgi:hypothetical protein